jgi:hypothetical protein
MYYSGEIMMRRGAGDAHLRSWVVSTGLHSSTFKLNVSAFNGQGVFRGV